MGMFKVKIEHPETAGAGDIQDFQDVLRADLSLKSWASCLDLGFKVNSEQDIQDIQDFSKNKIANRSTWVRPYGRTRLTLTAVTLYSGIFETGSSTDWVSSLAEASGKWKLA